MYMGVYLNSRKPFSLYEAAVRSPYFVDKSELIRELVSILGTEERSSSSMPQTEPLTGDSNRYLCITRPRRFGKTIMADMISAFFSKGYDSRRLFDRLSVSHYDWYPNYINKFNTIHISFNYNFPNQ